MSERVPVDRVRQMLDHLDTIKTKIRAFREHVDDELDDFVYTDHEAQGDWLEQHARFLRDLAEETDALYAEFRGFRAMEQKRLEQLQWDRFLHDEA